MAAMRLNGLSIHLGAMSTQSDIYLIMFPDDVSEVDIINIVVITGGPHDHFFNEQWISVAVSCAMRKIVLYFSYL